MCHDASLKVAHRCVGVLFAVALNCIDASRLAVGSEFNIFACKNSDMQFVGAVFKAFGDLLWHNELAGVGNVAQFAVAVVNLDAENA